MHRIARGESFADVEEIAESLGLMVVGTVNEGNPGAMPPPEPPEPPSPAADPETPDLERIVSATVRRSIARATIFRQLYSARFLDDGERAADIPVVTSLGALRREREAMRKWIEALGGEWPVE